MNRRGFITGTVVALAAVGGRGWAAPRSIVELGRRYQALRQERAQQPDQFDPWGSELHTIMRELGERLGVYGTPTRRLITLMGQPDKRIEDRWVYLWRGWHDYLYFEVVGTRITGADWYLAGE